MTQWIKDPLHKCENLSLHLRTHVKWEVVAHVQNPRNLIVRWETETRDRRWVSLANSALNKRPCLNNVEGKDQCLRPPYMLLNICTTTTHTHTHLIFKRNHLNTQMRDLFVQLTLRGSKQQTASDAVNHSSPRATILELSDFWAFHPGSDVVNRPGEGLQVHKHVIYYFHCFFTSRVSVIA